MKRSSLSRKLILGLIILVTVQSIIVGVAYYQSTVNTHIEHVTRMTHNILDGNMQLIDNTLSQIVEQANKLAVNHDLFDILNLVDRGETSAISIPPMLKGVLYQHFGEFTGVLDIHLMNERYNYSYAKQTQYEYDRVLASGFNSAAMSSGRYQRWIPTERVQSYTNPSLPQFKRERLSSRPVLRLLKQLNMSVYEESTIRILPRGVTRPLLLLDLDVSLYDTRLSESLPTENSYYVVSDANGWVIASTRSDWIATRRELPYLKSPSAANGDAAWVAASVDGESVLAFSAVSDVNGWITTILVPQSDVARSSRQSLVLLLALLVLTTVLGVLFVYVWVLRTMKPVARIVRQVETLRLDAQGEPGGTRAMSETDIIAHSIETMNQRIDRLMHENSEIAKREQEATILSLEMQINPHFLYNSLNKIYLSLYVAGHRTLAESVLRLSGVLHYSIDSKAHVVYLCDDVKQLNQYIEASKLSQDVQFSVYMDIDQRMQLSIVPKMLLQPFVENAILHGFREKPRGGVIRIKGWIEETDDARDALFLVEDNGAGVPSEKLSMLTEGAQGHIGCANVNRRIQLLYGRRFGISASSAHGGTSILIRLPYVVEAAASQFS
jgi:two-component system sensor histidine kinase YesM